MEIEGPLKGIPRTGSGPKSREWWFMKRKKWLWWGWNFPKLPYFHRASQRKMLFPTNHGFSHRVYVTSRELVYGLDSSGYTPSNKFESLPIFSANWLGLQAQQDTFLKLKEHLPSSDLILKTGKLHAHDLSCKCKYSIKVLRFMLAMFEEKTTFSKKVLNGASARGLYKPRHVSHSNHSGPLVRVTSSNQCEGVIHQSHTIHGFQLRTSKYRPFTFGDGRLSSLHSMTIIIAVIMTVIWIEIVKTYSK